MYKQPFSGQMLRKTFKAQYSKIAEDLRKRYGEISRLSTLSSPLEEMVAIRFYLLRAPTDHAAAASL